ncbi:MAG TPA: DEAD/DEAH box helicase [Bacteroidetes bacterium]|nr:DEAD/DEAH box helicase [Bacteroidota bacterium]
MTFQELDLVEPILRALKEEGYETPTPIQQQAIPHCIKGRDLLGCAQTGTGKTAAFAIPVLQNLSAKPIEKHRRDKKIKALVLTPTRELAIQIGDSFKAYGRHMRLSGIVIFGGVSQKPQVERLRRGIDILVATPGRLLDLMNQGFINLGDIEIFVLDEADRMLDMGFIHDVKKVIKAIPQKRQTLFFSATMPKEIASLASHILTDPVSVAVAPISSTAEKVEQAVYFVDKRKKRHLLLHLLENPEITSALVFSRTKHGANRIAKELSKRGVNAAAIHGNKSQTARQRALKDFKDGRIRVLVATDIAARGIDVENLSHVINFDLPNISETYVHRIGRTGRAGASGIALSFCDTEEKAYLRDIQKLIKKQVPVVEDHPYPIDENAPPPSPAPARQQRRPQNGRRNDPRRRDDRKRGERRPSRNRPSSSNGAKPKNDRRPQREKPVSENTENNNPGGKNTEKDTGKDSKWSSIFQKPKSGKGGFVIKSDRYTSNKKKSSGGRSFRRGKR